MTPQLQQAIKLLQMSNLELGDFVEQEIEKNPLLERGEGAPADSPNSAPETDFSAGPAAPASGEPAALSGSDHEATSSTNGDASEEWRPL